VVGTRRATWRRLRANPVNRRLRCRPYNRFSEMSLVQTVAQSVQDSFQQQQSIGNGSSLSLESPSCTKLALIHQEYFPFQHSTTLPGTQPQGTDVQEQSSHVYVTFVARPFRRIAISFSLCRYRQLYPRLSSAVPTLCDASMWCLKVKFSLARCGVI
jgi:hypothetical protein